MVRTKRKRRGEKNVRSAPGVSVLAVRIDAPDVPGGYRPLRSSPLEPLLSAIADLAVARLAVLEELAGCILCIFGAPGRKEGAASEAVRTALDIQQAWLSLRNVFRARWQKDTAFPTLRMGIGTGPTVLLSGTDAPRKRRRLPEAVRPALELCGRARTGETLVDAETYRESVRTLGKAVTWEARGTLEGAEDLGLVYACRAKKARLRLARRTP